MKKLISHSRHWSNHVISQGVIGTCDTQWYRAIGEGVIAQQKPTETHLGCPTLVLKAWNVE